MLISKIPMLGSIRGNESNVKKEDWGFEGAHFNQDLFVGHIGLAYLSFPFGVKASVMIFHFTSMLLSENQ